MPQNHLENLVKVQIPVPDPLSQTLWGWSLGVCVFNKYPGRVGGKLKLRIRAMNKES